MPPDGAIEPIDGSDDGVFRLLAGLPCNLPNQFDLWVLKNVSTIELL